MVIIALLKCFLVMLEMRFRLFCMLRLKFMVLSISSLLLLSCGTFDFGKEKPTEVAINPTNPSFEGDIKTLMDVKCMNCHSDPAPRHAPSTTPIINLSSAAVFKRYQTRVAARVFTQPENPMPPNYATPLTSLELAGLKKYLQNQGVETSKPTTKPTDTGAGGAALSAAFANKCASCHGAKGEGGFGPSLAKTKKSSNEFKSIVRAGKGGMPAFPNSDDISDADIAADFAALQKL